MSFIIYDILLLGIFVALISVFLYTKKKNLKREGLLFLYKASWGIKLIDYVGNKYKKTLNVFSYVAIGIGYCLMAMMLYLFGKIVWLYVFHQDLVRAIKIPPIMPLIPYLPKIFNLDFLPPFYFTYWIIILAIIAVSHEFAHGIFARYNNVRVKTTGFGFFPYFFPAFPLAFVELDEEKMSKKSKFSQMSVLAAGTFANILVALLFLGVLWIFFSLAFTPSGVIFDNYAYSVVGLAGITSVNGISLDDPNFEEVFELMDEEGFSEIEIKERNYLSTKDFLESQKDLEQFILYDSAPAINAELVGAISSINNVEITDMNKLSDELSKYSPGDMIIVGTKLDGYSKKYEIVLEEHPIEEERPWLGIVFMDTSAQGIMGRVMNIMSSFKNPNVYYEPKFDGFSWFTYNLLWWLVLISFSVALVNMLPVGIFDGGRFFYLTIWGITKNEKIAKKAFKFVTQFFLFCLFLIMAFWAWSFIG